MKSFLKSTETIDWKSRTVRELATRLALDRAERVFVARACFEWVRDHIPHTADHCLDPVTCSASEVLEWRTGFCYAKSHLLAALLRANGVPAGLVYQRLSNDDGSFCLHGLNAVWLPTFGWYRVDARGSRSGLVAEFTPPREQLPFTAALPGEKLFAGVFAEPVAPIVDVLRAHRHRSDLLMHMPDAEDLGPPDVEVSAWGRPG